MHEAYPLRRSSERGRGVPAAGEYGGSTLRALRGECRHCHCLQPGKRSRRAAEQRPRGFVSLRPFVVFVLAMVGAGAGLASIREYVSLGADGPH